MFTPTLRCKCAQPGLIDTMRKWSIAKYIDSRWFVDSMQYSAQNGSSNASEFCCLSKPDSARSPLKVAKISL